MNWLDYFLNQKIWNLIDDLDFNKNFHLHTKGHPLSKTSKDPLKIIFEVISAEKKLSSMEAGNTLYLRGPGLQPKNLIYRIATALSSKSAFREIWREL